MSCASGSYRLSIETAVRSTSIGLLVADALEEVENRRGDAARGREVFPELIEFGCFRQPAVPEEENDLLEDGVVRQRVNVVAAVAENSLVSVDITDFRLARDDAFQTCCDRSHRSSRFALSLL